ncbi:toprim domain-containing protein [Thermocrinis minervae]|uniref:toprim domain-containing protein n=1 Tax=Thermocrinis minervae TaxID=381751 RepID=UPI0009A7D97A|nr:toprim domain-containing protein [Thermocrinis minervae]
MEFEEYIKSLREASKSRAVLVEGKRDKEALSYYGVKNIYTLSGKRLTDLPDLLEPFREVILLLDLDREGEELTRKIRSILSSQGYILIEEFRERLGELGLTYVEDLYEQRGQNKTFGYGSSTRQDGEAMYRPHGRSDSRDKGRHRGG